MSVRPVFIPKATRPYFSKADVDFDYQSGQAASVKKKNVEKLHDGFHQIDPNRSVLEVSTKGSQPEGIAASAFNLKKKLPFLDKAFPVENIFAASKVFAHGGPYIDLLGAAPKDAKTDPRLKNKGELQYYQIQDAVYPKAPVNLFYNWIYLNALLENPSLAAKIRDYDAFTDIEFNPVTGSNCQAIACAVYKSLYEQGKLGQVERFEDFQKLMMHQPEPVSVKEKPEPVIQEVKKPEKEKIKKVQFKPGDWIRHPTIGTGQVMYRKAKTYTVNFQISGPREVQKEYMEKYCAKI